MKKSKTLYWIITGLFSAFMLFSALPDILVVPEAVTFMSHLGYPKYFIPFIGIAKLLGVIAILVPPVSADKRVGVRRVLLRSGRCDVLPDSR